MAELLFFLEAFCISLLLTGAILRFSLRKQLLDIPNDRSSHYVPKPRLGGIAITLSFFISCATLLLVGYRPFMSLTMTTGTLAGGLVISLVGMFDDLRGLNARYKLLAQIVASGIVIASGVVLTELRIPLVGSLDLGPLGVPLTFIWIVGIVNFYNFIDGIDGLAAGVGMIASTFLILIGILTGSPVLGGLYAILAGSCLGFLRFNFPPARIFMGDMGSTFIGFTFAVLSVVGARFGIPAFVTILLLGTLIGDATITLLRRIAGRKRIFSPHRTHYYQRLTSLGLSHKQVTLLEYLIAVLLGVSALFTFHGDRVFITFFSVIWVGFFLWALVKIRSMEKGKRLFWEGRTLVVALGDLVFIAASYILSYYLRLNFSFPKAETASMLISLPIVLVIRTAVFFYFGLYRGVWRYTTFDDLVRIAKAVSLSSAVMIVSFTFLFRFEAFPRSVFIIDWFILTVFLAGSRIATRWFHELPSHEEVSGKRVVIGGTGHVAELILHRVKKAGGMKPIGYVDDRSAMAGKMIHGLEVLGSFMDLERLVKRHDIEEIIVLYSFMNRLPSRQWEALRDLGVIVRTISDPSEIESTQEGRLGETLCAGKCVLVAGNGELLRIAGSVFPSARELVLSSNEFGALDTALWKDEGGGGVGAVYLGSLEDRRSIGRILKRHNPEFVFADFVFRNRILSNPLEGYLRTVLFPAERLASEMLRSSTARLIAVHCKPSFGDEKLKGAESLFELILRGVFRGEPERLTILRSGEETAPLWWIRSLHSLIERNGGVYQAIDQASGSDHTAFEILIPMPPPATGSLIAELKKGLEEGGVEAVTRILHDMEGAALVD